MTINVLNLKNFQIKCILNPGLEKFVKCLAFNKGKRKELACFYENEILIYDVEDEKIIYRIKVNEPEFLEFNLKNQLLIMCRNNSLFYWDMENLQLNSIKTVDKVTAAKWNPFNDFELAYSTMKSVSYHNINQKNRISGMEFDFISKNADICEICWYNLDENYKYLLVGLTDGHSILFDIYNSVVIMKFEKSLNLISSFIWLKEEPGTFLSFAKGSGRAYYWNVSKKGHKEIAKYSDSPIINSVGTTHPSRILISLENGSVIILDTKNRKKIFQLPANHSDTIFDLKYSPHIPNILATCSYDSGIKFWDIKENKIIWDLNVKEFPSRLEKHQASDKLSVFCLKWSPVDRQYISSGESKSSITIFDFEKKKIVSRIKLFNSGEGSVIGIDWNKSNTLIASCEDKIFLLNFSNEKMNVKFTYKVSCNLFQVKFDPFNKASFAVASQENVIKLFREGIDQPYVELSGHTQKVFGLSFNPNMNGILASSSDDFRIGIWDLYSNSKSAKFLVGHKNKTRHIVWLAEHTNILLSSSWDSTIKIWNTDSGCIIGDISENYSDVYGIDFSPFHPYLFTSCSRDNSIRFFNVNTNHSTLIEIMLQATEFESNLNLFKDCRSLLTKLKTSVELDYTNLVYIIISHFLVRLINF
jgi:WD40 repeat protein